jgi:transposase
VRRFETPPGRQAQADWAHLGTLAIDGEEYRSAGFTFTLGYSRKMMAEAAWDQKLGTLFRMHEEAFRQLGGVPEEILYDRMNRDPPQRRLLLAWRGAEAVGCVALRPFKRTHAK